MEETKQVEIYQIPDFEYVPKGQTEYTAFYELGNPKLSEAGRAELQKSANAIGLTDLNLNLRGALNTLYALNAATQVLQSITEASAKKIKGAIKVDATPSMTVDYFSKDIVGAPKQNSIITNLRGQAIVFVDEATLREANANTNKHFFNASLRQAYTKPGVDYYKAINRAALDMYMQDFKSSKVEAPLLNGAARQIKMIDQATKMKADVYLEHPLNVIRLPKDFIIPNKSNINLVSLGKIFQAETLDEASELLNKLLTNINGLDTQKYGELTDKNNHNRLIDLGFNLEDAMHAIKLLGAYQALSQICHEAITKLITETSSLHHAVGVSIKTDNPTAVQNLIDSGLAVNLQKTNGRNIYLDKAGGQTDRNQYPDVEVAASIAIYLDKPYEFRSGTELDELRVEAEALKNAQSESVDLKDNIATLKEDNSSLKL